MIMSNEKLAVLWHEVGLEYKRKIESILIETNKGFIYNFLYAKKPPPGYEEIILNSLRLSVKDALERYNPGTGNKFITYWIWWMSSHYSNVITHEVPIFPKKSHCDRRNPKVVPIEDIAEQGHTPEPYEHDIKDIIIKRYKGKERQIFLMLADGIAQKVISAKVNLSTNRIRQVIAKERFTLRRLVLQGF